MRDFEYQDGPGILLILAAVFLLVVVGGVVDLILDQPTTLFSLHVLFEVGMVLVSLISATYLARGWYRTQIHLAATELEVEQRNRERAAWQRRTGDLLEGLGAALSVQFEAWSLTAAERRTAVMLLKGLSHKRIARVTETSERTVRQHAVAVYRKSGLAGRAELAGFFLEALLLPEDAGTTGSA